MNIFDVICEYWQIIAAAFGIVYSFITLKVQNQNQEKRICSLEEDYEKVETTQQKLDTALAKIQTDLEWIKNSLRK